MKDIPGFAPAGALGDHLEPERLPDPVPDHTPTYYQIVGWAHFDTFVGDGWTPLEPRRRHSVWGLLMHWAHPHPPPRNNGDAHANPRHDSRRDHA
jgi:hypothetical protein